MKRWKILLVLSILIVLLLYIVGPAPETPIYNPKLPILNNNLHQLSDSIDSSEFNNKFVKPNNAARVIWADSTRKQTDWAIVYLHGFSASQMEGFPVHSHIADKFGMNLYLSRLSEHGLSSDIALYKMTPDSLWESAKMALAIGRKLGKKVILISTSTGGTLALKLAEQYPLKVDALINYSPNIRINSSLAFIMNNPWGTKVLSAMTDNGYIITSGAQDSLISQYWNTTYRMEALPQLQELIETTMQKEIFERITCPSLTLAYYKDENNQDPTVKVSAMRWMHKNLGTIAADKKFVELPNVGVHPFASSLKSKDLKSVEDETSKFIIEVLKIKSKHQH